MKGQVDIKHLNTLREFELCNTLGYSVIVGGTEVPINSIADLIEEWNRLRDLLSRSNNKHMNALLINSIRSIYAFFYRCHISEEGDKKQRDKIREFTLKEDYWTEI